MSEEAPRLGAAFPPLPPPPEVPSEPQRLGGKLHPAAIGVWSLGQLGAAAVFSLVNPAGLIAAVPFLVVIGAVSAVRYARFSWRIEDGALVIEQGFLERKRRVIPVDRIQSVDLVRRLSHRMFRVVGVHVQSVGSGEKEGQLDALAPQVASRLRAALLTGKAGAGDTLVGVEAGGADEPRGELLASVPRRRLLLSGLTEANITLLAGAAGLGFELLGDRFRGIPRRLPALPDSTGVVVVAVLAVLVAVILLVAGQYLTYWDFTLRRDQGELHVRRGLLEQRFDTIPLRRLQALRIEENLPRRLLGFAAVKADVAGGGSDRPGTDVLLPFARRAEAAKLVATLVADPEVVTAQLAPMPTRARSRRLVRAVVVTLVATIAASFVWGPPGLAALLLLAPMVGIALSAYRGLGHLEAAGYVVARTGWWVRRTAFIPLQRLQTLERHAGLFQRRRRLATLDLQIARSPGVWRGPRLIDLDEGVARHLTLHLATVMTSRG